MSDEALKREDKVRRRAAKFGYIIRKNRYQAADTPTRGGYVLVAADTNTMVLGETGTSMFTATLADIELFLRDSG